MGFILVFSIVVDTFVVRSILVPAMLSQTKWVSSWCSALWWTPLWFAASLSLPCCHKPNGFHLGVQHCGGHLCGSQHPCPCHAVTNQMGFILVFSIVVDTFVVRSILVPAMLSLVPCSNYWPCKMPEPRYTWLEGKSNSRS